MTQTQKLLITIGVVALVGITANRVWPSRRQTALRDACGSTHGDARRTCYARLISDHLHRLGVAVAMNTLATLVASDRDVAQHEHEYAHGIGIAAYRLYPDIVSTFVACGDGAASGCRHGFVQAYLESRDHVSAADLQSLCRPLANPEFNRSLFFQCVHGMGHGLTMFHGHDARLALGDCDLLATDWDRTSCYGGVFMEVFVNATAPHHPASELSANSHHHGAGFKAIDPADPLYPCSVMEQRYLYACYQIQTSVILYLNKGNIGAAARVCDGATHDMWPSCYESLGRDVIAYAERNPAKTAELCSRGTPEHRASCYAGAARSLVNWTGTTDQALALCRIVARDSRNLPTDGSTCFIALGGAIANQFATTRDREAECLRAEETDAISACRRGATLPGP